MIIIQPESIITHISPIQFFDPKYYEEYIKNFTKNNNIIDLRNPKPLIFITRIENLNYLYDKIIKLINNKFVLITHYGDAEAGLNDKILNHPLLIKWYGQNMSIISDKTEGIPIGLESKYWGRTNLDIINNYSKNSKDKLLYFNFSLKTNANRGKIMDVLLKNGFIKNNNLPWCEYIKDLSNYKFSISPKGNGVDCHRTWECLYLGVIPIIEKSIQMSHFNDLPILFVDDYNCISIEYLNEVYKDFKVRKFNLDKLDLCYWDKKIKEHFNIKI